MNSTLRFLSTVLAYADTLGSNPRRKTCDWTIDITASDIKNPQSRALTLDVGETLTLFNGQRSTTLANDTEFSIALESGTDVYRITWTGGTNPTFRTNRNLNLSGSTVSVAMNANGTATMTVSGGSFAGVQAGDVLWVPEAAEIGTQPLHVGNQGFWTVLSASTGTLSLARSGTFSAANETSTSITNANQIVAFSAAGVQVGDTVSILDGFATSTRQSFPVVEVTPTYIEIQSPQALAEEVDIVPSADGMVFYTDAKRFVHIESDQIVCARVNGDTGDTQLLQPLLEVGNSQSPGVYTRIGPTWSLTLVNKALAAANLVVVTAE